MDARPLPLFFSLSLYLQVSRLVNWATLGKPLDCFSTVWKRGRKFLSRKFDSPLKNNLHLGQEGILILYRPASCRD